MMELATILKGAAACVVSVGTIGGGLLAVDSRYDPKGEAEKVRQEYKLEVTGIRSDLRGDRILELAKDARDEDSPDYLCDALEREFVALCTEQPGHYLCIPDTQRQIKAKAGC